MCERVQLADGTVAIVCSDRRHRRRTCRCGFRATALCDHRNSDGRTCDCPLCQACALHVGKNRDYCRAHAPAHRHEVRPRLPFDDVSRGTSQT
jgi:hypothetical protein